MNPEVRRGEEAKRLMNEPLLQEAFTKIEAAILESMKRADVGASDAHRNLIVTLQLLGKVKRHIQTVIETGQMAALEEEKRKNWTDRFRKRA